MPSFDEIKQNLADARHKELLYLLDIKDKIDIAVVKAKEIVVHIKSKEIKVKEIVNNYYLDDNMWSKIKDDIVSDFDHPDKNKSFINDDLKPYLESLIKKYRQSQSFDVDEENKINELMFDFFGDVYSASGHYRIIPDGHDINPVHLKCKYIHHVTDTESNECIGSASSWTITLYIFDGETCHFNLKASKNDMMQIFGFKLNVDNKLESGINLSP